MLDSHVILICSFEMMWIISRTGEIKELAEGCILLFLRNIFN